MDQNEFDFKLPQPVQTIPYDSFIELANYVKGQEKRLAFLELHCLPGEWMDRKQAMQFLHVGSTKLWEMKCSGEIETSDKTGKTLYLTSSCREYLLKGANSKDHDQARFREILSAKKQKQKKFR